VPERGARHARKSIYSAFEANAKKRCLPEIHFCPRAVADF
jgi:hypothetical protein